jgi:hypothetical protein
MAQPPVLQVKVNGHLKTQSHVVTMMNGETVSSQKIPGVLAEVH